MFDTLRLENIPVDSFASRLQSHGYPGEPRFFQYGYLFFGEVKGGRPDNERSINPLFVVSHELLMPFCAVGQKTVIVDINKDNIRELCQPQSEVLESRFGGFSYGCFLCRTVWREMNYSSRSRKRGSPVKR